uniref:Putative gamma-cadinene synthase n=1 Tax=Scoparia dulcis TaxID=107240 RepID=A0A1W7HBY7_SCODU
MANTVRPASLFHPTIWDDDTFTSLLTLDCEVEEKYAKEIETLKEEVRRMLFMAPQGSKATDNIVLIDTLERLGLAYHFVHEIEKQMEHIFESFLNVEDEGYDLFSTSLMFRLLRQHGYNISCCIFDKFKNKENKFIETIADDVDGLLSLFEAACMRCSEEVILEDAMDFTTRCLKSLIPQLESPLREKAVRAIEQYSLHRGVPIVEARLYISIYEKEDHANMLLLSLAKLDFSLLQNAYRNELRDLLGWWRNLDTRSKLPYIRDRIVECYFWAVALHFEPRYAFARNAVTKALAVIAMINDTYDSYATLEEIEIFTKIVQRYAATVICVHLYILVILIEHVELSSFTTRVYVVASCFIDRWNINDINQLPDYMKVVYRVTLSVYEEYEHAVSKQGRSYAVSYAIEAMKQLTMAYHTEAKWFTRRNLPSFDEYVSNGVKSSSYYVVLSASLLGIESATEEAFKWLMSDPQIGMATNIMGRLMNDLASYARESRGGQVPTPVECYMNQYGTSREKSRLKLHAMCEDGWKDVNKEWVHRTSIIPQTIVERVLNLARITDLTYKNEVDGFTSPEIALKPYIFDLFFDTITM